MLRKLGLLVAAVALVATPAASAHQGHQHPNLVSQTYKFIRAFNSHDVHATAAMFSANPKLTGIICPVKSCSGRKALNAWLASERDDNSRVALFSPKAKDHTVWVRYSARANGFKELGISRIIGPATLWFDDAGKIARLDVQLDMKDPQSAKLAAAM